MSQGYICDRCKTIGAGRWDMRDGAYLPEHWSSLSGILVAGVRRPTLHLCDACSLALDAWLAALPLDRDLITQWADQEAQP